jgi:BirA family transcriptional regulator, biotin operon repressor / biotin---[acetyl-CoA-carboxylase] ligase
VANPGYISRLERFAVVESTNDVVARWLGAGVAEVCIAVADEQFAGRGREGRAWLAPRGAALLLSLGFRPAWLEPARVWRLAAIASLAMADSAEAVADLPENTIRLKWPNDLVTVATTDHRLTVRKLAGVLGETTGLATADPRAIVGIGTNVNWARDEFPDGIAADMTSLSEIAARPIDPGDLLAAFVGRLEGRLAALRRGDFDADEWQARQLTNDHRVRLELPGGDSEVVLARRVDPTTGGLVVEADGRERTILSGEIHHVRLADMARQPVSSAARV